MSSRKSHAGPVVSAEDATRSLLECSLPDASDETLDELAASIGAKVTESIDESTPASLRLAEEAIQSKGLTSTR